MTSVSWLFVLLGFFFLFYNAGWKLTFSLTAGFVLPVAAILIGLVIMLKEGNLR